MPNRENRIRQHIEIKVPPSEYDIERVESLRVEEILETGNAAYGQLLTQGHGVGVDAVALCGCVNSSAVVPALVHGIVGRGGEPEAADVGR